jgi:TrmH family RNA methyltransferase
MSCRCPHPPAIRADVPSVVLDRVQDAGNVGSILRSAAAFGFRQVLALEGTASLWSPKVLRAAMGAHFALALLENRHADALDALSVRSSAPARMPMRALPTRRSRRRAPGCSATRARARALKCRRAARGWFGFRSPAARSRSTSPAAAAICLYESSRRPSL